jgi:exonuclease VII small subunit
MSEDEAAEREEMATEDMLGRQARLLAADALDKYSEAMRLVGRLDAIDFYATVSASLIAKTYLTLKETKSYRDYPYRDKDGNLRRIATLEEFCALKMPLSYRRCHELAANYQTLGAELFEATERLGFREADYRAIRALPTEDLAAVELAITAAAQDNDRETALSVLAGLVARHTAARAAAERERDRAVAAEAEIRKDYEASAKLLGEAKAKVRRLESGDLAPVPLDEAMAEWPRASGYLTGEIRAHLTRIGLLIEAAERAIVQIAPEEGTPEAAMVRRACQGWYDGLGPDLQRLADEVYGVLGHLDQVVGPLARQ